MISALNQEDWKKVLAEIVGTFLFLLIGIGAVVSAKYLRASSSLELINVAFAHGVALAVAISMLGHISGAHFNPAVTIAMTITRRISPRLALFYIFGQLVGGLLACATLAAVLPKSAWLVVNRERALPVFSLGTPHVVTINITQAAVLEAVLTFFLVLAIFGTLVDPRPNRIAGFGVGLTVFVCILAGGPWTGAAMNPARAIAPALITGDLRIDQVVYWVGPIVGATVAALLYSEVFMPRQTDEVVTAPEITDEPLEPPLSEPGLLKD
jgi:MIP family channel proteins